MEIVDRIIKEELMRSIATFFFAVMGTSALIHYDLISPLFLAIIPFVVTGTVFSIFVYKRKFQEKKGKLKLYPSATSLKISIIVLIFATFGFVASGIRRLYQNDIPFGLCWIGVGIICIISIIATLKKLREKVN